MTTEERLKRILINEKIALDQETGTYIIVHLGIEFPKRNATITEQLRLSRKLNVTGRAARESSDRAFLANLYGAEDETITALLEEQYAEFETQLVVDALALTVLDQNFVLEREGNEVVVRFAEHVGDYHDLKPRFDTTEEDERRFLEQKIPVPERNWRLVPERKLAMLDSLLRKYPAAAVQVTASIRKLLVEGRSLETDEDGFQRGRLGEHSPAKPEPPRKQQTRARKSS
jgi:hypothetical protein